MKKLSQSLLFILLSTSLVHAGHFYIGANANLSHLTSKSHAQTNVQVRNRAVKSEYSYNHSARRTHPSFTVGFQDGYQSAVLGVEGYYIPVMNMHSHFTYADGFLYMKDLKATNGKGIAIKVGYLITPSSLGFLKVIHEKRKFHESIQRKEGGTSLAYSHAMEHTRTGRGFSVGLEQDLTKNITLNVEYKTLDFKPKSFEVTKQVTPNMVETQTSRSKININSIMVGLIYKFK